MNNNENNESQNEKGILKQKGFYIVLAICIIAVASILFATLQSAQETAPQQTQEAQAQDVENADQESLTEAQMGQASQSATPSPSVSPSPSPSEVPKNYQKAEISILQPVQGEVAAAFCIESLVYNKTLNIWQTHNGIDIVPGENAEVKAAMAGEISEVLEDPSLGKVVVIKHSNNVVTKYAGFSEISVAVGDKVQKGDVIGTCGTPPFEAHLGTHIHFEVWEGDKLVNPQEVFEQ